MFLAATVNYASLPPMTWENENTARSIMESQRSPQYDTPSSPLNDDSQWDELPDEGYEISNYNPQVGPPPSDFYDDEVYLKKLN